MRTPYTEQATAVRTTGADFSMLADSEGDFLRTIGIWMLWSVAAHVLLIVTVWLIIQIAQFFGFNIPLFNPLAVKPRDIEFVLVDKTPAPPKNKNTRRRAEHNSRAGGVREPNKPLAQQQRSAGSAAPRQASRPAQQPSPQPARPQPQRQQVARTQPVQRPTPRPQQAQQPTPRPQQQQQPPAPQPAERPTPPRPQPRTQIANATPSAPRLPVAPTIPTKGLTNPRPGGSPTGPVARTSSPSGGGSSGVASASGPSSQMIGGPTSAGSRGGSGGSRGGQSGSHGGGGGAGDFNQNGSAEGGGGRPGIDALAEPDFGPYIAELQRRIRRNWSPPSGDNSKRVVALFKISRDGRLLSVHLQNPSGSQVYDNAALAAVRASAPFRPLPPEFRQSSIDVQFTFDYDVYKGGGGARMR